MLRMSLCTLNRLIQPSRKAWSLASSQWQHILLLQILHEHPGQFLLEKVYCDSTIGGVLFEFIQIVFPFVSFPFSLPLPSGTGYRWIAVITTITSSPSFPIFSLSSLSASLRPRVCWKSLNIADCTSLNIASICKYPSLNHLLSGGFCPCPLSDICCQHLNGGRNSI